MFGRDVTIDGRRIFVTCSPSTPLSDVQRRLGHISSRTHWKEREENRAEIEARRAAEPWPWFEELQEYSRRNGSRMAERWDPPPCWSHKKS